MCAGQEEEGTILLEVGWARSLLSASSHCSQLQVQELRALGFGPQDGSLQALFQHGGDVARALTELQRQRLEPFHQRLWDRGPEPTPCWDGLDRQVLGVGEVPRIPLKGRD